MTADRADETVRLPLDRERRALLARLLAEGFDTVADIQPRQEVEHCHGVICAHDRRSRNGAA